MTRFTPSSAEVLAVPIVECGEPLVDIRRMGGLEYGPLRSVQPPSTTIPLAVMGPIFACCMRSHYSLRVSG